MAQGLVLVIEDDEWVSRLLSGAIRDADYDVVVCGTAKAGLETACAVEPDCIICDIDLPDHDGYWVARNVRTQTSRVAVTPFLFLSGLDDQEARLEGFHVGADVYMTKPFRVDEVVAQVGALVQMAARLRIRRDSMLSMPAEERTAIEGDISQMSIATVLTVLEMERRTGLVEVVSKKRRAQLQIASGYVVHGTIGGTQVSALAALRTMLAWKVGRFSFVPHVHVDPPMSQKSIGAFLIEAVRLEDENARDGIEGPGSSRRAAPRSIAADKMLAPALGGPPMTADDFAPPSSRGRTSSIPSSRGRTSSIPISLVPESDPVSPIAVRAPAPPALPVRTGLKLPHPPAAPRAAAIPPPPPARKPEGAPEAKPAPPPLIPRPPAPAIPRPPAPAIPRPPAAAPRPGATDPKKSG